jgi:hypothetical protein
MAQFRAPPKGQRRLRSFKMITPQDPPSPILEIPETSSPSSPRRRSTSTKERCDTGCSDNSRKSDLTQHSSSPTNKSRGESNNYVHTPTPSIARAESPKPTLYKFTIKNIPENFASQKKFHTLLTTHLLIKNIYRLVVNWNKTALLITSLPLPDNFLHNLNIATGSKAITCTPINKKTAPNQPNIDNPRKKPQFSVVIKHVDHDIDENDINQVLASLELPIQRLWRIKSRQSNKFTTLIRVITEDTATVDFLLKNGLTLFGKHHQCEPSKPPEPTPLQCTKCYQLGHPATGCTNKPACPKCPETHAPNNCEAATPKCLLCGGAHAAWSRKCPKLKDTPITDETPIAPTYIINPPAEFADPEVLVDESAEFKINTKQTVVFVTKILYDLFPLQRPKIHELVELASRQILRTKARISHTGQRIYFTFE